MQHEKYIKNYKSDKPVLVFTVFWELRANNGGPDLSPVFLHELMSWNAAMSFNVWMDFTD